MIDTTFMIGTMIHGDPDPEDLRKFFRALRKAQRDIDLRPELYTHYYKNEFPDRFHAKMDTRRWGPGERLVFEPYTKEDLRGILRVDRRPRHLPGRQDGRRKIRAGDRLADLRQIHAPLAASLERAHRGCGALFFAESSGILRSNNKIDGEAYHETGTVRRRGLACRGCTAGTTADAQGTVKIGVIMPYSGQFADTARRSTTASSST